MTTDTDTDLYQVWLQIKKDEIIAYLEAANIPVGYRLTWDDEDE